MLHPKSLQLKLPPLQKLAVSALSLGMLLLALPSWAGYTPRQNLGRPGNREGAATRSTCKADIPPNIPLTAFVPLSNIGLTTAAYPTFYWYFPGNNTYKLWQFKLYRAEAQGENETLIAKIYETTQPLQGEVGITALTLPNNPQKALELDRDYRWEISLICDPDNLADPDGVQFAQGWIRRVATPAGLTQALPQAKPLERYELYAQQGLWYDALKVLIDLRQQQPNDPALLARWTELLRSPAVKLDNIAGQMRAS